MKSMVANPRTAETLEALRAGDYVAVNLFRPSHCEFVGYVVSCTPERVRLKVHRAEQINLASTVTPCMNWDVVIPMRSVAFIIHPSIMPVGCECSEHLL